MEILERVDLFPDAKSLDRLAVTARIDRAAPRASPSTRVSTMPVRPICSSKLRAVVTASWPVMESATSKVSTGLTMSRTAAASAIIAASIVVRPAVSRKTTSKPCRRAAVIARLAMVATASPSAMGRV